MQLVLLEQIVNSQFYKHMKDIDYWTYDIEPQTKKEKQLMKQIILEDAFKILENCSALIVDGYTLLYPILNKLDNEDIHEFLILKWTHKGHNYEVKYNEGDNQVIDISGSSMFLVNATSDVHQLTILEPKQLG